MHPPWRPTRTLLTLDDRDGNSFAIVATDAGGVGLTRNGQPLPPCCWPADRMDDCVHELLRRTGRAAPPP